MSLLTKVWIIVFLPLWFLKFGPCPAKFLCHSFHYGIKLIYSNWSFFEPRFAGTRFYIVYCQVKWCVVSFHFRRSLFCVDFVGLYWTFLIVRHSNDFWCKWLLHSEDNFLKEFWFLFHWIQILPALWKFDKVLHLPNTSLCAPCSLVTWNGLCCWTTPCLKALLPWNFPRDPFHTELEYLPHLK